MVELRRLTNIIFLSLAKKHFDRVSRIEAYPHLLVQTHILVSYSSSLILLPSPFMEKGAVVAQIKELACDPMLLQWKK